MIRKIFKKVILSLIHIRDVFLGFVIGMLTRVLGTRVAKQLLVLKLLGVDTHQTVTNKELDEFANFSAYFRDDWVAKKLSQIKNGAKVLDAGAGQCRYKPLLAHTKYFAQDFAQYEGSDSGLLKETWEYGKLDYICDITSIPVEDNSFDVVLCTEVLEHIPDPIGALTELSRVLAPGGTIIITAPLTSGIHQEPYHFYGGFSSYFYQHHLNKLGIEIREITPIGGLLKNAAQESLRAIRLLESKQMLNDIEKAVIEKWFAGKLHHLDDKYLVEQFTVGYLVEGKKN